MIEGAHQAAAPDFGRIGELQGARCGVPRIRERRFFVVFTLLVEPVERLVRHQNLASDLKFFRPARSLQLPGHIGYLEHIGYDIITYDAVAPGKCPEKPSVPVRQADGGPVELQLTGIRELDVPEILFGTADEVLDLTDVVRIAEGQHRILVGVLGEPV